MAEQSCHLWSSSGPTAVISGLPKLANWSLGLSKVK
jgi:hypothetical protein